MTFSRPKNGDEKAWSQSSPTISRRDSPWNFGGSPNVAIAPSRATWTSDMTA